MLLEGLLLDRVQKPSISGIFVEFLSICILVGNPLITVALSLFLMQIAQNCRKLHVRRTVSKIFPFNLNIFAPDQNVVKIMLL